MPRKTYYSKKQELIPVGKAIQEARRKALMTQGGLSKKLGVSRTTVASWELGLVAPSLVHRDGIKKVLGVDVQVLIDGRPTSMSLRELLERVGSLSQVMSWSGIEVVPMDRKRMESFSVSWDMDPEGCGPEYEYSDGDRTWPPFYEIPKSGEKDPYDVREAHIDWDDTGWMVAPYSWKHVEENMKSVNFDFEMVKGVQNGR